MTRLLLTLPIAPRDLNSEIISPAMAILPPRMESASARVMLIAIAKQESDINARRQRGNGPARGLWQFERGGGVVGVMNHAAVRNITKEICVLRKVPFDSTAIWTALEKDDIFAACIARLLLWTDPFPLPKPNDDGADAAWDLYARVWRPGKPHPDKWPHNHGVALVTVFP